MNALFDQTRYNAAYGYETLVGAALSMDDAAFISTYDDENLFGFFSSSLPSQHSSPLSPPSEHGATDPYPDFSGPSSRATTEEALCASAHYGAQQVNTPVAPEMGHYSEPAQTWAPTPSRMPRACRLSDEWDVSAALALGPMISPLTSTHLQDVTNVAHAPAAFGLPVHTGEVHNTLADDPAAEYLHDSLTTSRVSTGNVQYCFPTS